MKFKPIEKSITLQRKVLLDYDVRIRPLKQKDRIYEWEGTASNYSVAGFEIVLSRHHLQYIIQYYVPSSLLVLISWVNTKFWYLLCLKFRKIRTVKLVVL